MSIVNYFPNNIMIIITFLKKNFKLINTFLLYVNDSLVVEG